jgi:hypothetical protein
MVETLFKRKIPKFVETITNYSNGNLNINIVGSNHEVKNSVKTLQGRTYLCLEGGILQESYANEKKLNDDVKYHLSSEQYKGITGTSSSAKLVFMIDLPYTRSIHPAIVSEINNMVRRTFIGGWIDRVYGKSIMKTSFALELVPVIPLYCSLDK